MIQKVLTLLIVLSALTAIYLDWIALFEWYIIIKPLTTLLIITYLLSIKNTLLNKYKNTLLIGLFFCMIGDVLVSYESYFIYGLISFLIAHLWFSKALIILNNGFSKNYLTIMGLLIVGGGYYTFLFPHLNDYKWPVLIYLMVILFMCWQGIAYYFKDKSKRTLIISVATILFLVSDSILAFDKFVVSINWLGPFILLTYWSSIYIFSNYIKETEQ